MAPNHSTTRCDGLKMADILYISYSPVVMAVSFKEYVRHRHDHMVSGESREVNV